MPHSASLFVPHQDAFYSESEEHDVASLVSKVFFELEFSGAAGPRKCFAKSRGIPFEKATGLDTKRSNLTRAPDFFQESQQLRFQPLQCNVLGLCYLSAMKKRKTHKKKTGRICAKTNHACCFGLVWHTVSDLAAGHWAKFLTKTENNTVSPRKAPKPE